MKRVASAALALFGLFLTTVLLAVVGWGWSYYRLPMVLREDHPQHLLLASGSGGGVVLGIVGTGLMTAMLLYTLRKKLAMVSWLGPLPLWLTFHVICGVTGPLFILVHGGLHWPTGLIAVGFWCMVLVALSGVFGRYVYGFLPRVANGRAMAWGDAMVSLADLRAELVSATSEARGHGVGQAVALVRDWEAEAHSVLDLFRLDRDARQRRRSIHTLLGEAGLSDGALRNAEQALGQQLQLKRGLEASRVAYRLFRYWHLFHRPLAMAMYVIVSLHVLFALTFGGSLVRLAELFS